MIDSSYKFYCQAFHDENNWDPIEISQDFMVMKIIHIVGIPLKRRK